METLPQPLVCTLERSELLARIRAWHEVVSRATTRRVEGNRLIATYPNDAQLLQQLRQLIHAEATCCSFLEFSVEETPNLIVTELRLPEELPAPMRSLILELMGGDRGPAIGETDVLPDSAVAAGGV